MDQAIKAKALDWSQESDAFLLGKIATNTADSLEYMSAKRVLDERAIQRKTDAIALNEAIASNTKETCAMIGDLKQLTQELSKQNVQLIQLNKEVGPLAKLTLAITVIAVFFAIASCWLQYQAWKHPVDPAAHQSNVGEMTTNKSSLPPRQNPALWNGEPGRTQHTQEGALPSEEKSASKPRTPQ